MEPEFVYKRFQGEEPQAPGNGAREGRILMKNEGRPQCEGQGRRSVDECRLPYAGEQRAR
jgi:hypothetical protein